MLQFSEKTFFNFNWKSFDTCTGRTRLSDEGELEIWGRTPTGRNLLLPSGVVFWCPDKCHCGWVKTIAGMVQQCSFTEKRWFSHDNSNQVSQRSPNLRLLPEEGLRFYSQFHLHWRYLAFDCVTEAAVHLCFVWDMCPGWNMSHLTEKMKETRHR